MVTKEEIYKISKIAKISVTEAELLEFTEDINDILRFVDTKDELTHKDKEFCNLNDLKNIFRDDEEVGSLTVEEALQNTQSKKGSFFLLDSILKQEVGDV